MKKYDEKKLVATIQSLTDSTGLTVYVGGLKVELEGRRSPYNSHKEAVATEGFEDIPKWMCLKNARSFLAISPVDPGGMWHEKNWLPFPGTELVSVWGDEDGYREMVVATDLLVAQIPTHMIAGLLAELRNCAFVPKDAIEALTGQLLVWVAFPVRKTTGRWVEETLPGGGTKMFPEWVEVKPAAAEVAVASEEA